jgi:hypothetical protein
MRLRFGVAEGCLYQGRYLWDGEEGREIKVFRSISGYALCNQTTNREIRSECVRFKVSFFKDETCPLCCQITNMYCQG